MVLGKCVARNLFKDSQASSDDKSPLPECVEFVNDIVVEYIRNMVRSELVIIH